jgi:hypothetical protein
VVIKEDEDRLAEKEEEVWSVLLKESETLYDKITTI